MVKILNSKSEVVETVETKHVAFKVVEYLDRTNPSQGPHTAK